MQVDGQYHCGRVTFEAEIDPQSRIECHCTDCQTLTGSPYRVTVICSVGHIRMTGNAAKIYAKTGENGRIGYQHFCGECGSALFTSGEAEHTDDWGIRWGRSASGTRSGLHGRSGSFGRAVACRSYGFAGPADGLILRPRRLWR